MTTTMAERSGLLRRVGTASLNHWIVVSRIASLFAPSTLCGSSMTTRSPRAPVIEPDAAA